MSVNPVNVRLVALHASDHDLFNKVHVYVCMLLLLLFFVFAFLFFCLFFFFFGGGGGGGFQPKRIDIFLIYFFYFPTKTYVDGIH